MPFPIHPFFCWAPQPVAPFKPIYGPDGKPLMSAVPKWEETTQGWPIPESSGFPAMCEHPCQYIPGDSYPITQIAENSGWDPDTYRGTVTRLDETGCTLQVSSSETGYNGGVVRMVSPGNGRLRTTLSWSGFSIPSDAPYYARVFYCIPFILNRFKVPDEYKASWPYGDYAYTKLASAQDPYPEQYNPVYQDDSIRGVVLDVPSLTLGVWARFAVYILVQASAYYTLPDLSAHNAPGTVRVDFSFV